MHPYLKVAVHTLAWWSGTLLAVPLLMLALLAAKLNKMLLLLLPHSTLLVVALQNTVLTARGRVWHPVLPPPP
jgi:hypothetical protein